MTSTSLLFLLIGAAANLVLTPLFIKLAQKHGLMDHPGHRKIHSTPVAKLGGVSIILSLLTAVFVGLVLTDQSLHVSTERQFKIAFILGTTFLAAFLGFVDDLYDLRPRYKLALQALFLGAFTVFGFRFEVLHLPGMASFDLGLLAYPFTLLWLLAVLNGFNFMDGIDGLAASVTAVCLLGMGAAGYMLYGNSQPGIVWVAALGAILVFLYFNWKPAKIYLGDSGSSALGTLVATSLLAMGQPAPSFLAPLPEVEPFRFQFLVVTLIVGYPFLEVGLSTLRRGAKRFFFGRSMEFSEKEHIHHRMLQSGLSTQTICVIAALFQTVLIVAALLASDKQNAFASMLLVPLAMLMTYYMPRWDFFDYLGANAQIQQPHFKIANYYNSIQKLKLALAHHREEVLALVSQTCREFGIRCFRVRIPADVDGKGGMDYLCSDTNMAADDEDSVKAHGALDNHDNEFYDFCELPGHRGEAFWIFDSHTGEDDLDVEYRVLMNEFMKEALEVSIKLGDGKEHLEIPSVARLPHKKTSGHQLRKRTEPRPSPRKP